MIRETREITRDTRKCRVFPMEVNVYKIQSTTYKLQRDYGWKGPHSLVGYHIIMVNIFFASEILFEELFHPHPG